MKKLLYILFAIPSLLAFDPSIEHQPLILDSLSSNESLSSQIEQAIVSQTSVKSQGKRGTCTLFSTAALLEFNLKKIYNREFDLSEEWLEFVIMNNKTTEGSTTNKNLKAIFRYGISLEKSLPYIGEKWFVAPESFPLAQERCGHYDFSSNLGLSCLLGHNDPKYLTMPLNQLKSIDERFYKARVEAKVNLDELIVPHFSLENDFRLKKLSKVRSLLDSRESLIMGTKLYYASWNSSKTETYNIQQRDKSLFYQGLVGHPELDSMDREISSVNGGGHSILIVGYDDDFEISHTLKMKDGTYQEFTHKGAYIFKNSWGTKGFGKDFVYNGKSYPGYGAISYKYAHEFGTFYHLPLN